MNSTLSANKKDRVTDNHFESIHQLFRRPPRPALFTLKLFIVLIAITASGLFPKTVLASEHLFGKPISEIRIHGNSKTRSDVVIYWSELEIGQVISQETLDLARQNILDTDLFKLVSIELESDPDRQIVNIYLEEKYFTILLPRISRNADGDVKIGLRLRKHNINGADQTLKALVEKADLSTGDTSRRYQIKYDFPQFSKPYHYRFTLSESTTNTDDDGFLNVVYEDIFSFSIVRDWHTSFISLPLTLTTSATYQKIVLREPYPDILNELEAGHFNRLSLKLEYDDVHNEEYRRFGRYYSLTYHQGLASLDSDYASNITEFEARHYYRLSERDNFNSRLFAGYAHDTPFSHPFYEIGSAGNIRGLDKESCSGNVKLFVKIEYVKGFTKYPSFRGSLFLDIGNVYDSLNDVDLSDMKTSIGFGLRWKATSFVNTDLFIDLAYDTDTGENKVYGGTSLNF
jgi:outer membrane protein assembly factor BamA